LRDEKEALEEEVSRLRHGNRGYEGDVNRLSKELQAAEAEVALLREALEKHQNAVQFDQMYHALKAAEDIAVRADNGPPISDPRWVQIADALIGAHDPFCSVHDAGGCNCALSRQALAQEPDNG